MLFSVSYKYTMFTKFNTNTSFYKTHHSKTCNSLTSYRDFLVDYHSYTNNCINYVNLLTLLYLCEFNFIAQTSEEGKQTWLIPNRSTLVYINRIGLGSIDVLHLININPTNLIHVDHLNLVSIDQLFHLVNIIQIRLMTIK